MSRQTNVFASWLQLFRAPNLLTVPGDPIAGFLLAAGNVRGSADLEPRLWLAVGASLCFYMAGLAMNDAVDVVEDRRDRPERPLPSGAIPASSAWLATWALMAAGLLAITLAAGGAGLVAGMALTGSIALYNGCTKRIPGVGAINMGLCRGLSVCMGSVVVLPQVWPLPPAVQYGAGIIALYIAAVTHLARHETHASLPPMAKVLPVFPILFGVLVAGRYTGPFLQSTMTTLFALALMMVAAEVGSLFRKQPPALPPVIGSMIRVLLPVQAAFCFWFPFSAAAGILAAGLLLLLPVAYMLSRRFYAS